MKQLGEDRRTRQLGIQVVPEAEERFNRRYFLGGGGSPFDDARNQIPDVYELTVDCVEITRVQPGPLGGLVKRFGR